MAFRANPVALPVATVGCYLTDGHALVRILEADDLSALGEDALTDMLVELSAEDLRDWRTVIPA